MTKKEGWGDHLGGGRIVSLGKSGVWDRQGVCSIIWQQWLRESSLSSRLQDGRGAALPSSLFSLRLLGE